MKILVTGAGGFAGSFLIEALSAGSNDEIYGLCRRTWHDKESRIKWLKGDLLHPDAIRKIVNNIKPDRIYHLAAYPSPQDSFRHPVEAITDTAAMQINLLEACLEVNINPRILVVGSGQIYGANNKLPINETAHISCSSPYTVAKACQENITSYYLNRGLEIIIARPFNHTGPRQRLGFLVPDLAQQVALTKAGTANIINVGNLSSKRDFTDVRDVVAAYIDLLKNGKVGEAYNVCSGKSVSGQEILDLLIKISGLDIIVKVDSAKMRPSDVSNIYGNPAKLKEATNWQPKIKLSKTLSDTLDYWQQVVTGEPSR